jgi:SNF2 family DNA or RNA helicase
VTQERAVKVFRLVMQDSVEERLLTLQKVKKVLGKGSMEKLSKKEEENLQLKTYKSLLEIEDGDWRDTFEDDDSFIIDDDEMTL